MAGSVTCGEVSDLDHNVVDHVVTCYSVVEADTITLSKSGAFKLCEIRVYGKLFSGTTILACPVIL